jgi:hypothetical protein
MRALPLVSLCVLIVSVGSQAQAQSDAAKEQALRRYQEGVALHDRGEEEGAYVRFAQAYSVVQTPPILFNLARTEQLTGRLVEAASHFKEYVAHAEHPRITAELRDKARSFLAQIDGQLGHIAVEAPTGTALAVDGVGRSPGEVLDVKPGTHTIEGTLGPERRSVTVDCAAGGTATAKLVFDTPPGAIPASEAPASLPPGPVASVQPSWAPPEGGATNLSFWTARHVAGVVLVGAGALLGAMGTGFKVAAANDASRAASDHTQIGPFGCPANPLCSDQDAAYAAQTRNNEIGWSLVGVGIASAVTGGSLLLWPDHVNVTVSPSAGRVESRLVVALSGGW